MQPLPPRKIKANPEALIQEAIIKKLRQHEWLVKATHGNMYQSGFPDLYCCHHRYGQRWVEVKNKEAYQFTPAQLEEFPRFTAAKAYIWILVSDSNDEYNKLFGPPNWQFYLDIWKSR